MLEIDSNIWMWQSRHPEWRSKSELVRSYALKLRDGLAIVDPLIPDGDEGDAILDELLARSRKAGAAVFVTIPCHFRDAERVAKHLSSPIVAHASVEKRLTNRRMFINNVDTDTLPFGAQAMAIGKPRRAESPLYFPELRTLVVGDSIVSVPDGLRVWAVSGMPDTEAKWTSYRERLLPSFHALLDLDVERVLPTHGEPILADAKMALGKALVGDPIAYRVADMWPSVTPQFAGARQ